jgi:hypothetical protein
MNWVSVLDKLPAMDIEDGDFKSSQKVIAFFRNGSEYWCESVTLKLYYEDGEEPEWYFDYDGERVMGNKITHWTPLILPN